MSFVSPDFFFFLFYVVLFKLTGYKYYLILLKFCNLTHSFDNSFSYPKGQFIANFLLIGIELLHNSLTFLFYKLVHI